MEKLKREICENELLIKDILFIDGLTRVGKSMLNTMVSSLGGVSHPQFLEPLEQLLPMYKSGHMDRNAISSFIRLHLNERFYNYALSRNLNFRYDDLTSIHNSRTVKDFYKNLSKDDGDDVIEELKNNNITHQFQTHDILTHFTCFLDLNIDVKLIELFRNPIDTIHSWYVRGWGIRFDNEDARSFTSLFKFGNKTLPHYAIGHEEKYFSFNEMEKCVFLHNLLLVSSLREYKKLSSNQKSKLLLMKYESVLEEPEIEIDRICRFLSVKRTEYTEKALKDARVPRNEDLGRREGKLEKIKTNIRVELYVELMDLVEQYDNDFYGIGQ